MDKARIAEWILSLVLPPGRAAAITGDLVEGSAEHTSVWFWASVSRTVISRIWNDVHESPSRMVSLALCGCALLMALSFAYLPVIVALALAGGKRAVLKCFAEVAGLLCVFQICRWIGLRAPGKEIASCIAFFVTQPLLFSVLGFAVGHYWGPEFGRSVSAFASSPSSLLGFLWSFVVYTVALTGALRARRKFLGTASK